jgi:hypothetical protein
MRGRQVMPLSSHRVNSSTFACLSGETQQLMRGASSAKKKAQKSDIDPFVGQQAVEINRRGSGAIRAGLRYPDLRVAQPDTIHPYLFHSHARLSAKPDSSGNKKRRPCITCGKDPNAAFKGRKKRKPPCRPGRIKHKRSGNHRR